MKKEESFEENIKQLEGIVSNLEKGDLTLEESVKTFENGMNIAKKCNELLDDAEKRIMIILNDNGKIEEKDFLVNEEND